jgi:hypothetical protein
VKWVDWLLHIRESLPLFLATESGLHAMYSGFGNSCRMGFVAVRKLPKKQKLRKLAVTALRAVCLDSRRHKEINSCNLNSYSPEEDE